MTLFLLLPDAEAMATNASDDDAFKPTYAMVIVIYCEVASLRSRIFK